MGEEYNLRETVENAYKNIDLSDKDYIEIKNIIKRVITENQNTTN